MAATGAAASALAEGRRGAGREDEIEVPVQVNGKLVNVVKLAAGADEEAIKSAALADEKVVARIAGKTVVKTIVVKGKLVNLVVGGPTAGRWAVDGSAGHADGAAGDSCGRFGGELCGVVSVRAVGGERDGAGTDCCGWRGEPGGLLCAGDRGYVGAVYVVGGRELGVECGSAAGDAAGIGREARVWQRRFGWGRLRASWLRSTW